MNINLLPLEFLEDMKELLGDEYEVFLKSYEEEPYVGLRVNRLKISVEDFLTISPFKLEPIPWTDDGFYFNPEDRPAKHPYYHAGLYYLQEPSAMAPVSILKPRVGDVIADLCAAPGGKSLQAASAIGEEGLIVSNDISASRLKALVKNFEMAGVRNGIVMCSDPTTMINTFEESFDKIIIDAPCSGEGMFRRDVKGIKNYTIESRQTYKEIQVNIMDAVSKMLKVGGVCSYSTCTFTLEENEILLNTFLNSHSDFVIEDIQPSTFENGLVKEGINQELSKSGRLWPHKLKGEGHFIARLRKDGLHEFGNRSAKIPKDLPEAFRDFVKENLNHFNFKGTFKMVKEKLLLEPHHSFDLKGVRVLRSGWYIGDLKKNRFEPSQAFAMGLKKSDMKRTYDLSIESDDVYRYLRGETIPCDMEKGWILVTVDGYPLGWGKVVDKKLKNKYPASWRLM